ncbi:transmembrane 9 superfamily member 2-like [Varanus komodoensis]|uniref:transmembrane 9 superfamily member 2-like n=1 Tax=Varanus komodoensis TaxID=61221 RepID=UPI001CF7AFE8|nr:transmembrane 9 superfamily member 2-like [Varanus komodoensis]
MARPPSALLALALLLGGPATRGGGAFYLPGLAPVSFCESSEAQPEEGKPGCQSNIQLFVNRLDSVESVLPYEYDA